MEVINKKYVIPFLPNLFNGLFNSYASPEPEQFQHLAVKWWKKKNGHMHKGNSYRRVLKYRLILLLKGIKREAPLTKLNVVFFLLVHEVDPQILWYNIEAIAMFMIEGEVPLLFTNNMAHTHHNPKLHTFTLYNKRL